MEITDIVILVLIAVLFLIRVFFIKKILGVEPSKKGKPLIMLHCFQCEIEMPVKEYKGQLYCENCGLIHLNEYID